MATINLEKRKKYICGSDVAAALGVSRYKTKYQLWEEKTNPVIQQDNDQMYFGREFEPILIKKYEKNTNKKCAAGREIYNPKFEWLLGNIDAWVVDEPLLLECKTTRFFDSNWGEEGTDQIPCEYLCQVALYCIIADPYFTKNKLKGVDIAALGSTSDFRIYTYKRNKELEEEIIDKTHDFWQKHIVDGVAPDPTDKDDLSKIYKMATKDSILVADNTLLNMCESLKNTKEKIKELETEKENFENEIKLAMKDAETLIDVAGKPLATWKNEKRKNLDVATIKETEQDIYNKYLKLSEIRPFKIK